MPTPSVRAGALAAALIACSGALWQGSGHAQDLVTHQPERVVVTATRSERAALDVPASVDVLTRDDVRDAQLRINLSESLWRIPGVVASNRQNYAQDLQISIRGYGARSTFGVRGLRLYLDGIPATQPDGQGQVSNFPLNAVERIEVLRGPFSALYGNSSGGVIAMTTRLAPQPLEAELSVAAGSFDTWRAALAVYGGTTPYAYSLDASFFSTGGYREHSAATRDVLNARVAAYETPLGRLRVTLNAVDMPDAQDPLGLTRAQWQANPQQASPAALQFDTRKSTSQDQLGFELGGDAGAGFSWQAIAWIGQRAVEQYQAIPVATQANPNHPGGVIDFDRNYGGVDARLQARFGSSHVTFGVDFEQLDEDRRGYENFAGLPQQLGVRGRLRRDESNRVQSLDAYAQLESELSENFRLLAGVRSARVTFNGTDEFLSNGDDSGSASYNATNPTVGLNWRLDPNTSLYAAYGQGFETPTLNELAYRPNGSAGYNTSLEPATSRNVEFGAKSVSSTLRAAFAVFQTSTSDDLVVQTNAGGRSSFTNAGSTRRRGAELGLGWQPTAALTVDLAATAIQATYSRPFLTCVAAPCTVPSVLVAEGKRLPGIPAYTAGVAATYRTPWADVTAEWRGQSQVYVDDRNTDAAPGYGIVNLALARSFIEGSAKFRAFLRIDNLLNARYIGSVIVNEANGRYFEPAPGRQWLLGLDLGFR